MAEILLSRFPKRRRDFCIPFSCRLPYHGSRDRGRRRRRDHGGSDARVHVRYDVPRPLRDRARNSVWCLGLA